MEDLFSLKYGIGGICVLLTLMVLVRVAEFVYSLHEKRESLSENAITELTKAVQENTFAVKMLDARIATVETSMSELPKLKNDLRRSFCAVKEIAGDDWPRIRDVIMKDGYNS
jgi:hypothetical protein